MDHTKYLHIANQEAVKARATGNTPFGAVLVGENGEILMTQGNVEKDLHDATAHAERILSSRASQAYNKEQLWKCTLYTTVEPCPMCTGAVYWANIGRIVYGITEKRLLEMTGSDEKNPTFSMGAAKVIEAGQKPIELIGPVPEMEEEIIEQHKGFWADAGIRLYADVQGSADAAAKALADGKLEYDPDARCDHHGHHHDDDCGHDHCNGN